MSRYINPVPQLIDGNGKPIVGAKLFFFNLGTTVKKTIYSDSGLSVAAENPQLSNANGRFSENIYLDGLYTAEQQDNTGTTSGYDGVQIWSKAIGDTVEGQFQAFDSTKTYNIPDLVIDTDDFIYQSLTDGNQGNTPSTSPTDWAKSTFVKAGVVDGVTVIKDANSNEALTITATASAVNNAILISGATGVNPQLNVEGEDVGFDIEGVTLKNGGLFVDTVTAKTTNGDLALDGDGTGIVTTDALSATTTNGNLALTGNGTGHVTIDGVHTKIIDIGDWNMDTTASVTVAHGLTLSKIREVRASVRHDSGTFVYNLLSSSVAATSGSNDVHADATNIALTRETGGLFDNANFATTSYNRGWITVIYVD